MPERSLIRILLRLGTRLGLDFAMAVFSYWGKRISKWIALTVPPHASVELLSILSPTRSRSSGQMLMGGLSEK